MASETYAQARARLLKELAATGWKTKPSLKVPQAALDDNTLYFKSQAVYLGAYSMWIDIRNMPLSTFAQHVEKWAKKP